MWCVPTRTMFCLSGDQATHERGRIFPSRAPLVQMVATLLQEQNYEWQVADPSYFSVDSMTKVDALDGGEDPEGAARSDCVRSSSKT